MTILIHAFVAVIMLVGMTSARMCEDMVGYYRGRNMMRNIQPTGRNTFRDVMNGEVFEAFGDCHGRTSKSPYFSYSSCVLNVGGEIFEKSGCVQGASGEGPTQEKELRDFCKNKKDGKFHHPTRCEAFVQCLKKEARVTPCPAGQQFDAAQKKCEKRERVTCLEMVGNTSYGAKGQQRYGEIVLTRDQIREAGRIMQVKLQHVEGQIKCDSSKQQTMWGCKPGQSKTVITDEKNRVLFDQGVIHREGENTSLIFNKDLVQSPNMGNLPFVLRVWYQSDLHKEGKIRSGVHKVTVLVTVVKSNVENKQRELEKPLLEILQQQRSQISEVLKTHPATLENKLQELFKELKDNLEARIQHKQPNLQQHIKEEMKKLETMSTKDPQKKKILEQQHKELKQALERLSKQQPKSDIVTFGRFFPTFQPKSASEEQKLLRKPLPSMSAKSKRNLKVIFQQKIQQIRRRLTQQPRGENWNVLKMQLQNLQRQLQRLQQTRGSDRTSGNEALEDFCLNKPDGNYNHPSICEKYVTCSNKITFVMDCPSNLQFDLASNKCVTPYETTCLKYVGTANYGTKGNDFGSIILQPNMVGGPGYLTQVKLVHVDGYVACSMSSPPSRWGCNNEPPQSYTREIIGTIVTDDQNNELYRQERIPGYDGMSDFIIFNNQTPSAPHISSLPYTLRFWYNEDLDNISEEDNRGRHGIAIYVTIAPHFPIIPDPEVDPELDGYCDNRNDGDYRHPSRCDSYVSCTNDKPYIMACPSGLQFNAAKGYCDYPENARCLQFIGTTTFGAKDNQYGTVVVSGFDQERKGKLIQVKLEHIDGGVKCSQESSMSYWGCNNVPPQTYTEEIIGTLVTDSQNQVLMHERNIPGKDGMSQFVVFNKDLSIAPVIAQDPYQIRIWYDEDFSDSSESDNSGSHLINVYATIAEE